MKKRSPARALGIALWTLTGWASLATAQPQLHDPREVRLADVRQLTFGGENAEAYWSPDGTELIFQRTAPPWACDQIFRLKVDGSGTPQLVSTGQGRTTCSYFFPAGDRVLFSSTHLSSPECPPRPDFSQGYVWALYNTYEIMTARPDGSDIKRLTTNSFYDAEATICPRDGSIVFTSTRDGDLELYRMDPDGSKVKRLTETPGYDGGAFFSADCQQLVWRAARPQEEALADYQRLLADNKVRPTALELWVANADGSEPRQVTYLGAASFAPYFFPDGKRIIFSSNYGDPRGREFDLWAIDVDGTDLERITYTPQFDGFPMFSQDGQWLAFASNRNQGKPGETDIYVARFQDVVPPKVASSADRLAAAVGWLAADARLGRGIGTLELEQTRDWLAQAFAAVGLTPAGEDGYFHAFEVPIAVRSGPDTHLALNGSEISPDQFVPAAFSASGEVVGEVVPVGYGVSAPELQVDDYQGLDVTGKIVLVRRFTPSSEAFDDHAQRRYGDLRYKAWNAREHGAIGAIIADLPLTAAGQEMPEEAPLPSLRVETRGDAGLPVVIVQRGLAEPLFSGAQRARLRVDLQIERRNAHNVVGRVAAGSPPEERLPGAILIGAHYDHLGLGGPSSLMPDVQAPHNGADDNASGTAALLEIGRALVARQQELQRDVILVAFSGEETGLLGSAALVRRPPPGLDIPSLVAMINLDMVGRLRHNRLSVLGVESAAEWPSLVEPACAQARLTCKLSGDGYGPSDQMSFYTALVPVLHLFTGAHSEYHKPTDDVDLIHFAGIAQIAELTSDLAMTLARRPERLTYQKARPQEPAGDTRSYGASLGTIPDYTAEGVKGVLLSGVRPDSPAEKAGIRPGDLLVELAGHPIGDIYDFVFVLRQAKPGTTVKAVVVRDSLRTELTVTFGKSRGIQ